MNDQDSASGRVRTLLQSSDSSWVQSDSFDLDPKPQWALPENSRRSAMIKWLSGKTESYFVSGNRPSGVSGEFTSVGEDAKLAVIGNTNFLTSAYITMENSNFLENLIEWIMYDEIRDIQLLELQEEVMEKYKKQRKGPISKLIRTAKEHYGEN